MSAFGLGGGGFGGRGQEHPQLKAAKIQAEGATDLYNRMADMCFEKCIGKYQEAELNVGEMSCTDRCVSKFMESYKKVGDKLQEFQQMEQAKMQQTQQAQQMMGGMQ
ncbi:Mitochondrial import inner membrane translocase subunit Tim10 [Hondaea fermentalgiana]|uniref:Mitochondrial import inner membrane translocase subunit n=1 Tax=Hondaea fermentalgiana TaxID=2315210 RepID=A0A2R5GT20_9STRA|nr:Mitochondrial import inner membrane translocase subunit Tim10 [Hondaea fermentalgiana]|eukprot:GBG33735.1 Mitochondrial import inner membrane translocase subunit Tim10 [Hondaea fermentalgiana]